MPEAPLSDPLAFWIGSWSVATTDGRHAGTNEITRALSGNAVLEHWRGASGVEGLSLFWFDRLAGGWRQVWATDVGFAKEKRQVDSPDAVSVRFEGRFNGHDDRTTLTPFPDGTVRQLIEASAAGRDDWQPTFDAIYTRVT